MTTSKSYDYLNRLTNIVSGTGVAPVSQSAYAHNTANQRTAITNADDSKWVYTYDSLGQVISGKKYWSDGTPVAGQQFEYGFDDIGNRKTTKVGGDQNGANLRPANYTNNTLNQFTGRGVPGYADVMGLALLTNTVTVNGQSTYRKGEYFRKEMSVNNSSAPVWTNVSVAAPGETTVAGNVFVRKTPETFGYDADGNLTNDGRWTFTWDAENRLTKAESLATNPTASKRRVVWEFDGQGRRIRQTTYNGSSGSYVVTEDLKILSDGWRHLAELNATNNALVRSYVWGLDVSGTMDGAGGVGGLLMLNSAANGVHFCAYDGNGNVTALVRAADGKPSAHYEYGPFGEALRVTGLMGKENPFRFSTKRADSTTDLVLYEYRVYSPALGRWMSRDPIAEEGGINLPAFAFNNPLGYVDRNGLDNWANPGGGQNTPPITTSCVMYRNRSSDRCTAVRFGCQWLSGTSPSQRSISGLDPMAIEMRNAPEIVKVREAMRDLLRQGCRPGIREDFARDLGAEGIAEFYRGFWWQTSHVLTSPHYPQSNGKLERWHRTLKEQAIRPRTPLNLEQARAVVAEFVEHYNTVRLHSAIGYLTPKDKLEGRAEQIWKDRDAKLEAAREKRRVQRAGKKTLVPLANPACN